MRVTSTCEYLLNSVQQKVGIFSSIAFVGKTRSQPSAVPLENSTTCKSVRPIAISF